MGLDYQVAFDTLKIETHNCPILQFPDFEKAFIFETNASNIAISAIPLQKNNSELLPVVYYRKKLDNT